MDDDRKHALGQRAFFVFFFSHIKWVVIFFLVASGVWYAERWLPFDYLPYGDYATKIMFLLAGTVLFMVFFWTYMEYHFYTYTFTPEAFIMTSGYVTRNETAALYHQIQNVNIRRSPLDRVIGVSSIVILMVGAEREAIHNQITLPAVGRKKAKLVQKELLARARRHIAPET